MYDVRTFFARDSLIILKIFRQGLMGFFALKHTPIPDTSEQMNRWCVAKIPRP